MLSDKYIVLYDLARVKGAKIFVLCKVEIRKNDRRMEGKPE